MAGALTLSCAVSTYVDTAYIVYKANQKNSCMKGLR